MALVAFVASSILSTTFGDGREISKNVVWVQTPSAESFEIQVVAITLNAGNLDSILPITQRWIHAALSDHVQRCSQSHSSSVIISHSSRRQNGSSAADEDATTAEAGSSPLRLQLQIHRRWRRCRDPRNPEPRCEESSAFAVE